MPSQAIVLATAAAGLILVLAAPTLLAAPAPAKAKPAARTNVPAPVAEIPASVFVAPGSPKEGRNPFFPRSTLGHEDRPVKPSQIDTSVFVLNGLTSPPRQTAMINGRTFEPGEEGEVKLSNGSKVLVKCTEIRKTSAMILVGGQVLELRFRSGI